MKIRAKDIVCEQKKPHRWRVIDHGDKGYIKRTEQLDEIKANVADFAYQVLTEYELPATPDILVGNIVGFEELKPVREVKGYIVVHASFDTYSGRKVRIAMPIPIYHGHFLKPSLIIVNNKRMLLSEANIKALMDRYEVVKPTTIELFSPDIEFLHEEVINRGMFAAPLDPLDNIENETLLTWKGYA